MPTTRTLPTLRRACAALAAGTLVGSALGAVAAPSSGAASSPVIQAVSIAGYPTVLGSSTARSLYLLSTEKGAKLHCKGSCLAVWLPVLVKDSVKSISVTSAVKGKVGFVDRTAKMKQVTINSYPVYTYTGDTGARQSHGEGVVSFGGTWHLVSAAAKTAAATPVDATLQAATIKGFADVLENISNDSLYVLSSEKGAKLDCTGACLTIWPPLLVASGTKSISLAAGVDGTIGFVARSSTTEQVTYNSYPVYTFAGDSGPGQSNGEGIDADGGTWTLAHAAATTATGTPFPEGTAPSGGGGGW